MKERPRCQCGLFAGWDAYLSRWYCKRCDKPVPVKEKRLEDIEVTDENGQKENALVWLSATLAEIFTEKERRG